MLKLYVISIFGSQKPGSGDCLTKTQDSAQGASRSIGSDTCPVLEGLREKLDASRSLELKPQ